MSAQPPKIPARPRTLTLDDESNDSIGRLPSAQTPIVRFAAEQDETRKSFSQIKPTLPVRQTVSFPSSNLAPRSSPILTQPISTSSSISSPAPLSISSPTLRGTTSTQATKLINTPNNDPVLKFMLTPAVTSPTPTSPIPAIASPTTPSYASSGNTNKHVFFNSAHLSLPTPLPSPQHDGSLTMFHTTPPRYENTSGTFSSYSTPSDFPRNSNGIPHVVVTPSTPLSTRNSSYSQSLGRSRTQSSNVSFPFGGASPALQSDHISNDVANASSQMASSLSHRFPDVLQQVEAGIYTTKRIGSFAKRVSNTLNSFSKQLQHELATELSHNEKLYLDQCGSYTSMATEMMQTMHQFADKMFDFSQRLEMEVVGPMASLQKDTENKKKAIQSEELRSTSDITKSKEMLVRQRVKCNTVWHQLKELETEAQEMRQVLGLSEKEAKDIYEKNSEQLTSISGFFSSFSTSQSINIVFPVTQESSKLDEKTRKTYEKKLLVLQRKIASQLQTAQKEFSKCEENLRAVNILSQDYSESVLPNLVTKLEAAEHARLSWTYTAFKSYTAMFQDFFDLDSITDKLNKAYIEVNAEHDINVFISNLCTQHGLPPPVAIQKLDLPCTSVAFTNNDWRHIMFNPTGHSSLSQQSTLEATSIQYSFQPMLPPPIFKVEYVPSLNYDVYDMITLVPGTYVLITSPMIEAIMRSSTGTPHMLDSNTVMKALGNLATPFINMNGSRPIPKRLEFASSAACANSNLHNIYANPTNQNNYLFSHSNSFGDHHLSELTILQSRPTLSANTSSYSLIDGLSASFDEKQLSSDFYSLSSCYDQETFWIGEIILPPKSSTLKQLTNYSNSTTTTPLLSALSPPTISAPPSFTPNINATTLSPSLSTSSQSAININNNLVSIGILPPKCLTIVPFDENVPLAYILYIPSLRRMFLDTLRKEYSYENYEFWELARTFRLTDWNELASIALKGNDKAHYAGLSLDKVAEVLRRARSKHICDEFIRSDSPRQINIRGDIQIALLAIVDDESIPVKDSIFVDSEVEIYNLLSQDSLARFKKTEEFQSYLAYVQTNPLR